MINKQITLALPASMISDTPHLREKTMKIGYVGRAAAIFRVTEVLIFPDNPKVNQKSDSELIMLLLRYMETPQYLRKFLFGIKPELKFAGVLPPLRTPHHPLAGKICDLKVGEYREGVIISRSEEGTLVEIGLDRPVILPHAMQILNKRVTVQIVKVANTVEVKLANRTEVPDYWGFEVCLEERSLSNFLCNRAFDLTVATSKFADRFTDAANTLIARWKKAKSVLLLFGAPARGLFEIAKEEGFNLTEEVDFVLNTIPNQGTETVRTEEAVMATLAVLNVYFDFLR